MWVISGGSLGTVPEFWENSWDSPQTPPTRNHRINESKRVAPVSGSLVIGHSPHFSHPIYCGSRSGCVFCVALGRPPHRTVQYVCGGLGHPLAGPAPCIHSHLHPLATIRCEKCGLERSPPLVACIMDGLEEFCSVPDHRLASRTRFARRK